MVNNDEAQSLPLPPIRCMSKAQAAEYLGIGTTLLAELDIPSIKFGRRIVYDRIDLDGWLEEYKNCERRRVGKDLVWTNSRRTLPAARFTLLVDQRYFTNRKKNTNELSD